MPALSPTILHVHVEHAISLALTDLGLADYPVSLSDCPSPELGDIACSVALKAARALKRSPLSIAENLAVRLRETHGLSHVDVAAPGYVNIRFDDAALVAALADQGADPDLGVPQASHPERIVIDFGGANIKPLHVGHLRSLVIGESIRRLLVASGHTVISDIHLGDWGLPAGMILAALRRMTPEAAWFPPGASGPFPEQSPITFDDIATLYPAEAAACKADPERMAAARDTVAALQAGDAGLTALWRAVVTEAKSRILQVCQRLSAHFDLTLGESDAQPEIPALLDHMAEATRARREGSALLLDVAGPNDTFTVPPLVLEKADGSALYATTDLATLVMRRRDLAAQRILYVVDARQSLHFLQVFRAARTTGLAEGVELEHIAFGTVNGPGGRPYKTRDGSAMGLVDLLDLATATARQRLLDGERLASSDPAALDAAAEDIGIAALKIADLASERRANYILDLDRAVAFEGNTGPYLLYAVVRMRSILSKAGMPGPLMMTHPLERRLAIACLRFPATVARATSERAPHELVAWAFNLATEFSRFYTELPVLAEEDAAVRQSRVALCVHAERVMATALDLLGCRVPPAM